MTIIWDAWDDVDDKKSNYTMPETDETLGKEIGMFLNHEVLVQKNRLRCKIRYPCKFNGTCLIHSGHL